MSALSNIYSKMLESSYVHSVQYLEYLKLNLVRD